MSMEVWVLSRAGLKPIRPIPQNRAPRLRCLLKNFFTHTGSGPLCRGLQRPHFPGQSAGRSTASPAAPLSCLELQTEHGSPVAPQPQPKPPALQPRPERCKPRGPALLAGAPWPPSPGQQSQVPPKTGSAAR